MTTFSIEVKRGFPEEIRFRYVSEIGKSNYSVLKTGDKEFPILMVEGLPPNGMLFFELFSEDHQHSLAQCGFHFYQGKKRTTKHLSLREDGTLCYQSNGQPRQEIVFESIGITRPKSPKLPPGVENVDRVRICYRYGNIRFFSSPITNNRSTSHNTITILLYQPTYLLYQKNESKEKNQMLMTVRENVKSKTLAVQFREKTSDVRHWVIPAENVEVTNQRTISFPIPPQECFKSNSLEFRMVRIDTENCGKKHAPNSNAPKEVASDWKSFEYIPSRLDKRKYDKTFESCQMPESVTRNEPQNCKPTIRQKLMEKQNRATPMKCATTTVAPVSSHVTMVATQQQNPVPQQQSIFYTPEGIPVEVYQISNVPYATADNGGMMNVQLAAMPQSVFMQTGGAGVGGGQPQQYIVQASSESYQPTYAMFPNPPPSVDSGLSHTSVSSPGDSMSQITVTQNEHPETDMDNIDLDFDLPDLGNLEGYLSSPSLQPNVHYERDGAAAESQGITKLLEKVNLAENQPSPEQQLQEFVMHLDPKRPAGSVSDKDVKRPKAGDPTALPQATTVAQVQVDVAKQMLEFASSCQDVAFKIPHMIAFGMPMKDMWLDVLKKVPQVLTGEDAWGDSALNNAFLKDNSEGAAFLIQAMIDVGAQAHFQDANDDGHTPLILLANSSCDEELTETLLLHGALLTAVDNMKRNVFHYAICNGRERMLEILLKHAYLRSELNLLEDQDVCTLSPIHLAAFYENYPNILKMVLQYYSKFRSSADLTSGQTGYTVLHQAIAHKLFVSLETLLGSNLVNVNLPFPDLRRPLQVALDMNLPKKYVDMLRQCHAEDGCVEPTSGDEEDEVADEEEMVEQVVSPIGVMSAEHYIAMNEPTFKTEVGESDENHLFEIADHLRNEALERGITEENLKRIDILRNSMTNNHNNVAFLRPIVISMWKRVHSC